MKELISGQGQLSIFRDELEFTRCWRRRTQIRKQRVQRHGDAKYHGMPGNPYDRVGGRKVKRLVRQARTTTPKALYVIDTEMLRN